VVTTFHMSDVLITENEPKIMRIVIRLNAPQHTLDVTKSRY